jgi:hypothetical protein
VTCENCSRSGHTKQDCWSKGGGKDGQTPWKKKGKGKKTSDSANSTEANDSDSDYDVAALTILCIGVNDAFEDVDAITSLHDDNKA